MSNYVDALIQRGYEIHEAIVRLKKKKDDQSAAKESALSSLYSERIMILEKLAPINTQYNGIADVKSKLEGI